MESLFADLKIQDFINPPVKSKITNERQSVIKMFVDALNLTAGTRYKKNNTWVTVKEVKPSYVAYKLSHLKIQDLYGFYSVCRDSKSGFSKTFYGALKTKKDVQNKPEEKNR